MSQSVFQTILVPVEFEYVEKAEDATASKGQTVELNDDEVVDLGPYTIRALELAARLVGDGEIWLVHAHHDFSSSATWLGPEKIDELNAAAGEHCSTILETVAQKHCPGVKLRSMVQPGSPADVILDIAQRRSPDAIILAASSRGRINRAIYGSTVDKVTRRAHCPVIVVPSEIP